MDTVWYKEGAEQGRTGVECNPRKGRIVKWNGGGSDFECSASASAVQRSRDEKIARRGKVWAQRNARSSNGLTRDGTGMGGGQIC